MTDHLYLVGDYEAAASIPIGAMLGRLEAAHNLPVAFYEVSRLTCTNGCACMTTSMPRNTLKCGWRI